ncbi:hypothetical protein BDV10DRAFT_24112 [Aspergillus recurvatus]
MGQHFYIFSFTGKLVVITLVSFSPLFRLIQHFLRNDSIVFGQEHIKSVLHALSLAPIKQADDMEFGRHSPVRHTVVCACSTASARSTATLALDVDLRQAQRNRGTTSPISTLCLASTWTCSSKGKL